MKKTLLMLLGVCLFVITAAAQERTVAGRVTDNDGFPLPGVSVKIKGTTTGVSTGQNGDYSIRTSPGAVLQFSFIGSVSQERTVGADNKIDVVLVPDAKALEEVVFVGYGTQKKATLTGAISTVDVDKVMGSRPTTDVARALQGAVPGLTITSSSGALGTDPSIRLRSMTGSLNGNGADPLILLDNVEIPNLQSVNPEDIESVSVLKDAASASIYGTRAAWGVVLITTKTGKKGTPPRINYSNNISWATPTTTPEMAPAADGAAMALAAYRREPRKGANYPEYNVVNMFIDDIAVQKMRDWKQTYGGQDLGPENVLGRDFEIRNGKFFYYREWDPGEEFLTKWAPQQKHDLSVSGGSDKINYNLGAGYLGQTGAIKANPDEFSRYSLNLNVNSEVTSWLSTRGRIMHSNTLLTSPYNFNTDVYDPLYYLYRWPSNFPYGTYNGQPWHNAVTEVEQAHMTPTTNRFTRLSVGGTFKIIPGLTVDADYTYGATDGHVQMTGGYATGIDFWNTGAALTVRPYTAATYDRAVYSSTWNSSNNGRVVATYNKTVKDHAMKFMLGGEAENFESNFQRSERRGLIDPNKGELDLATGDQFVTGDHGQRSTQGIFGRVNYTYKNKYLFEMTGRYDGSSQFPANDRWAFFPGVSAGYVLSEENFMSFAKPVLSTLKFRGSWGQVGHQDVGGAFISTISSANSGWIVGGKNMLGVGVPTVVSNSLTWETVTDLNLGLDARFLDQKLGVTFDWYTRTTSDMISAGVTLPNSFGASAPRRNYGELQTKGWELAVDFGHHFSNGLGLNLMASLSDFTETVTKYANTTRTIGNTIYYEGKQLGEIWGYETDRYFTNDDFIQDASGNPVETAPGSMKYTLKPGIPDQSLYETANVFYYGPGDIKYKDLNGDGVITRGSNTVDDPGDQRVIGNSTPRYQYGFRIGADFKGFDFGVYFQGVGKRDMWIHSPVTIPGVGAGEGWYANQLDYWTPENPGAFYPRPSDTGQTANVKNFLIQTKYLLDLSYLRAKNINFGYTLPARLTEKVKLNKARIYFSGENLFEKDNLNGVTIDPEVNYTTSGGDDQRTFGRVYPYRRSLSFGLQVTL